ncbi:MAG: hypothetical protein ABEJ86_01890 [Halococcoides sp.]
MAERLPSDHDAIDSHRVTVERIGRTSRPSVSIPAGVDLDPGDRCVVSLAGTETHAVVDSGFDGDARIGAVADSRSAAGEGPTGRFADWLESVDIPIGRSIALDVITPGYKIGLRPPGERVIYHTRDPPDRSLTSIARDLVE